MVLDSGFSEQATAVKDKSEVDEVHDKEKTLVDTNRVPLSEQTNTLFHHSVAKENDDLISELNTATMKS